MDDSTNLQTKVFLDRYALKDADGHPLERTYDDMWRRVSRAVAQAEEPALRDGWAARFHALLRDFKFVPAGRILSGAGSGHDVTYYNCLSGDTGVHTEDGVRPIRSLRGPVRILSQGGVYRTATFASYGVQELWDVTLADGAIVRATAGHEWPVHLPGHGVSRVQTTDLAGCRIPINPRPRPLEDGDYRAGVEHGIVYGDGSVQYGHARVPLFGEKMGLVSQFSERYPSRHHDASVATQEYVSVRRLPASYKQVPAETESPSYWRGFFAGLVATDGHVDKRGCVMAHSGNVDDLRAIARGIASAGIVAVSITLTREFSPFDGTHKPMYKLNVSRTGIAPEDLLKPSHRAHWEEAPKPKTTYVRVASVAPSGVYEEVYCCDEPETHTFTIERGLLTGNCFVVAIGEDTTNPDAPERVQMDPRRARHAFYDALSEMTDIMARSGGVGMNLSGLPPAGTDLGMPATRGGHPPIRPVLGLSESHPDLELFLAEAGSPLLASVDLAVLVEGSAPIDAALRARLIALGVRSIHRSYVNIALEDSRAGIVEGARALSLQLLDGHDTVIVDFSNLRPRGAYIKTVNGTSSGPVAWMYLFDAVARSDDGNSVVDRGSLAYAEIASTVTGKTIQQGGSRRGALMIMIDDDHPDVEAFVAAKRIDPATGSPVAIQHANMSVCVSDAFMYAVSQDGLWDLNWQGRTVRTISARGLWRKICEAAWTTAEPGVVFMQRARETSPMWYRENIRCVNPCFTGDTLVSTTTGPVSFRDLVGTRPLVYCNVNGRTAVRPMYDIGLTRRDAPVVAVSYNQKGLGGYRKGGSLPDTSQEIRCTPDHLFRLRDGSWRAAGDLQPGDRLYPHTIKESLRGDVTVRDGLGVHRSVHQYLAEYAHGRPVCAGEIVHHKDLDHTNNALDNLEILPDREHKILHSIGDMNSQYRVVDTESLLAEGVALSDTLGMRLTLSEWMARGSVGRRVLVRVFGSERAFLEAVNANHVVLSVTPSGTADVYDGTVEEAHNFFVADKDPYIGSGVTGVLVHNCGEQALPAGGVCNLGAMNLAYYVSDQGLLHVEDLKEDVVAAVRFLDNVIDATPYFSKLNVQMQREGTRRIGLGTMGLADALIKMRIAYGSPESLLVIASIYAAIRDAAYHASIDLAKEKGSFGFFDTDHYLDGSFIRSLPHDIREGIESHGIRNGVLLTQAPTGTTSMLAGVSSGIEPVFSFATLRKDRLGEHIMYHPLYEAWLAAHPEEPVVPSWFVSSRDLTPTDHIKVQAEIQRYTDSSISKTCNAPNDSTVDDVMSLYQMAYDLGCKGVTYYREGSRDAVLTAIEPAAKEKTARDVAAPEYDPLGDDMSEPGYVRTTRPREEVTFGYTRRINAPEGAANVTINSDMDGPFEIFINIGKAGSDVMALAEALGRLISFNLRMASPVPPEERLSMMSEQLRDIGGSRSVGFGPQRVTSLPDAVAQVMAWHLDQNLGQVVQPAELAREVAPPPASHHEPKRTGNLCPDCGAASLVREEGCMHCLSCAFSQC